MTDKPTADNPTKSRALTDWVAESARLTQPDRIVWCDGSEAERERLTKAGGRRRGTDSAQPRETARTAIFIDRIRTMSRAPKTSLSSARRRGKTRESPTTGWRRTEAYREAARAADGLDGGPDDVRDSVRDGSAGIAVRESRRGNYRQHLRRAEHAHHDADGCGGAGDARRIGRLQPGPALHARSRSEEALHLPFSARQHDLVGGQRVRRQRVVEQEVFRAADRQCAGAQGRLVRRAYADRRHRRIRRARRAISRRRFRVRAARPTWRC